MSVPEITYSRASSNEELEQILKIQKRNLPQHISLSEKEQEGYVTVHHTLEALKKMNDACPHIIAKHNDDVVGYALCTLTEFIEDVPILKPLFRHLKIVLKSKNLTHLKYLIMGQVCIDKDYRRLGIFRSLYQHMASELKGEFDAIITEVNSKNVRSSGAHKAVGFQLLDIRHAKGEDWEQIILKL
ncbi:GNAT family N-acetyltransferase [Winogradskyella sp. 3972H.M.0a.05]|uniref:GNAT family N-acetyltransferase n=1 Tax=Winogradskyella sp. 3972H.M.0a.05 TaxID=2950277 RepID=UPI003394CF40